MSPESSNPESLAELQTACKTISELTSTQFTIVCSPYPEMMLSGALLCKAIMRTKRLFQVQYSEPIIPFTKLNAMLEKHPNSTMIFIGVNIEGKGQLYPVKHPILMMAGETKSRSSKIIKLGFHDSISALTYSFAQTHFRTTNEELTLAAIGTLLQYGSSHQKKGANLEIIQQAIEKKLLQNTKGFRLFGKNSLPIYDSLFYSIHPYIPRISGNEEACNEIVERAEIPLSKRNFSLDALSSSYAQAMTQQIVPRIDSMMTSSILGPDFLLLREDSDTPLRYLSSVNALVNTSWARRKIGDSFAVWLGDRARSLRNLLDSHMIHCRNVLAGVRLLKSRLESLDVKIESLNERIVIIPPLGIHIESLSDVGIIALTHKIIEADTAILQSENSIDVVNLDQDSFFLLLKILSDFGINYITTSRKSLRVVETSKQDRQTVLNAVTKMTKGE